MNIAEALIYFQIGTNLRPQIDAALGALHSVAMRILKTGKSTCYASELAAITEGRDLYKIQLSLCSQAEAMRATRRVADMQRSGAMDDVKKLYEEPAV